MYFVQTTKLMPNEVQIYVAGLQN